LDISSIFPIRRLALFELNPGVLPILRSPGSLKPLALAGSELRGANGEAYPILDGIICLLAAEERGGDLGDARFYDQNPFGLRDWSNPAEVEQGVDAEFKAAIESIPRDAWIADIGCGTGRISNFLSLRNFENVVSLDYSLPSLRMVRMNSRNTCVWGNNLSLPFASGAFDLVVSTGVIHHTPDPLRALAECARIVKPGGRFFLKLRNIHSPYGYLYKSYGAALRFFDSRPKLRGLSDLFGFRVYKLTRAVFYHRLPAREDPVLRGKYENLFIKKMITFFTARRVRSLIAANGLSVEAGRKVGFTHRQHYYLLRKARSR
jgi:SAM-dependent methyltransferase